MNRRYTLVVFLIFVALAAVAYTQRETEPLDVGEGTATPTPAPLFELEPADVQAVAVVGATGSYTLTRVAGGWEVDGEAASDLVDGVVERMANPNVLAEVPGGVDPDNYGFATASLTVTLKTAGGDTRTLQVGEDAPVSADKYVRLEGDERIVLLSSGDIGQLERWIDSPPLAPTPTPEVTETPEGEGTVEAIEGAGEGEAAGEEVEASPESEVTPEPEATPEAEEAPEATEENQG